MSDYKNLDVWKISHQLVLDVYSATATFPKTELYGLTSQIRRAAYSIPVNIAEGYGRYHRKELLQFLNVAKGSANELEYELLLSKDLGYLDREDYENLNAAIGIISKMLNGLIKSMKNQPILSSI